MKRVYTNMDEALITFSNQWGKESEYFINYKGTAPGKCSTNEPDVAQMIMALNKSIA